MKTINIFLETKDLDYSTALSRSLLKHSNHFSIEVGRPQPGFGEWDIYLTDDMNAAVSKTVYLTEDPSMATVNEENSCYIIHKYQHVGFISNILRLAHSDYSKTEMTSEHTVHMNIISVCSSSGGTGCTSVALGICQELTRFHGKKVLYISLEDFDSTAKYFSNSICGTSNLVKYIYAILNKKDCPHYTSAGYMTKDEYGIFAFHPARGRNPLCELTGNEFIQFINCIASEDLFTDLILDCGNGLGDSIVTALQLSTVICHVAGKNPDMRRKANHLCTVANRLGANDNPGIIEVLNFYVAPEPEDGGPLIESNIQEITIEEDPNSFNVINECCVISLDKMFGQGIRDITKHIALPSG